MAVNDDGDVVVQTDTAEGRTVQLYQRTPPWVVPRPNSLLPNVVRQAFAYVPGLRFAVRSGIYWGLEGLGFAMTQRPSLLRAVELVGRWNIRRNVRDKELRRKLTPTYRAGCKRILYSGSYYQAVANPKATLITCAPRQTPSTAFRASMKALSSAISYWSRMRSPFHSGLSARSP